MHYKDHLFQSENTTAERAILFDTKRERKKEGKTGGKEGRGKEENIKIYYVEPETCHFYISQTSMWNLLNAKRIVFIYQNISMNAAFHQGKEIFDPFYLPVLYD